MTGVNTFEGETLRQPDVDRFFSSKFITVRQLGGAIQTSREDVVSVGNSKIRHN